MARDWDTGELVMISALEHYSYCPRQCALIHLEQSYEENIFTLRGNRAHQTVDEARSEERRGVEVETSVPLRSDRLGLVGRADLVEFRAEGPYPIEYKRGAKKRHDHAEIQLCAQGICLEEMLGEPVSAGAIYFTGSNRRQEVPFSDELRRRVEELTEQVRTMLTTQQMPDPVNDERCPPCSLQTPCQPAAIDNQRRQREWIRRLYTTD